MSKYIWMDDRSSWRLNGDKMSLTDRISYVLSESDHESGELEILRSKLNNTKALLSNLIVFLSEKGMITEEDWKTITGRRAEGDK